MLPLQRPTWLRYSVAIALTAAALAVKLLLARVVTRDEPVLLFFASVMVAALYGGLGAGLLATALCATCDAYFFMAPFSRWALASIDEQWRLGMFILEGCFISWVCAGMNSARRRAEANAAEARELEGRLLENTEAEQRRIGHDLHDGLGQHLTGIALMARRLQNRLNAVASVDAEEAGKVCELANAAIAWTHDLSRTLSPPTLRSGDLPTALVELAAHAESIFQIECTVARTGVVERLDLAASAHLYRIAQEAITNAVRHGQAKHVGIRLDAVGPALSLQIIDDGVGAPAAGAGAGAGAGDAAGDGMGLRIMRYRATMIGATIEVRHPPAGGTIIECQYRSIARTGTTPKEAEHGTAGQFEGQIAGVSGGGPPGGPPWTGVADQ
jgi:signal transduction histidine kinase